MSTPELEAAAGLLGDLGEEAAAEAVHPPAPPLIPRQHAAPPDAEQQDVEGPEFTLDPDLPDEIQALLEEPDDDEYEADYHADREQPAAEQDTDEYEDPEVKALRLRAIKAEKRAAFLEGQKVKRERAGWVKEAQQYFPLAAADGIAASSKREFLREAKRLHEAARPAVERYLEQQNAGRRAQEADAWGPPASRGNVPHEAARRQADVEEATRRGGLKGGIKAMLASGELNL